MCQNGLCDVGGDFVSFHWWGLNFPIRRDWLVFREEGGGSEYEGTVRLTRFARKKKNVSHVLHLFDHPQERAGMEKCGGAAGKAKMWP